VTLASIAILGAKSTGINCTSVMLNCADPYHEIRVGGFRSSVPPHCDFRDENGLKQFGFKSIGFRLCSVVQQSFSIVLAFFPKFGYFVPRCVHKLDDRYLPPQPPLTLRISILERPLSIRCPSCLIVPQSFSTSSFICDGMSTYRRLSLTGR